MEIERPTRSTFEKRAVQSQVWRYLDDFVEEKQMHKQQRKKTNTDKMWTRSHKAKVTVYGNMAKCGREFFMSIDEKYRHSVGEAKTSETRMKLKERRV